MRNIVDNEDGALVDPAGYPLPPCIVMERGESLDLYSQRNAPDRATAFVVRPPTTFTALLAVSAVSYAF